MFSRAWIQLQAWLVGIYGFWEMSSSLPELWTRQKIDNSSPRLMSLILSFFFAMQKEFCIDLYKEIRRLKGSRAAHQQKITRDIKDGKTPTETAKFLNKTQAQKQSPNISPKLRYNKTQRPTYPQTTQTDQDDRTQSRKYTTLFPCVEPLQRGQFSFFSSHISRQCWWNKWEHCSSVIRSSGEYLPQQMEQTCKIQKWSVRKFIKLAREYNIFCLNTLTLSYLFYYPMLEERCYKNRRYT